MEYRLSPLAFTIHELDVWGAALAAPLRALYPVSREPLPSELQDLLAELDEPAKKDRRN
jgi:hypothetical protein